MDDVITGEETICRLNELSVTLGNISLFVHFDQVDPGVDTRVLEGVRERDHRLLFIGVFECETIRIFLAAVIVFRCLDLLYVITAVQGQVRFEDGSAVCAGRYFLDEGVLLRDGLPVIRHYVLAGINPINAAGKRVLRCVVLFRDSDFRLLAFVPDGHLPKNDFPGRRGEGQGDVPAFPVEDVVFGCCRFLHGVGP